MKYNFIPLIIFIFTSLSSFAQSHTWTGTAGDGLWSSATNWSTGTVPGMGATVGISGGAIVHLDINSTIGGVTGLGTTGTSGDLYIDAGVTLTLTEKGIRLFNAASDLIVNGDVVITNTDMNYSGLRSTNGGGSITVNAGGSVSIDNVGSNGFGIASNGSVINDGSISVSNVATNDGITISGAGSFTNNGSLSIANTISSNLAVRGNVTNTSTSTFSGTSFATTASVLNDVSFSGGTISPGNSTGLLSFRTGFSPAAGTSYIAEIEKVGGVLSSDVLHFHNGGSANFNISNIDVTVTDIGMEALSVGDEFSIVTAQFGFTGTFASINVGPPMWDVTYSATGVTLKLLVALPVEFSFFNAEKTKDATNLTWQTANESNNKGFSVLKSADGKRWEEIAFIAGAGNSSNAVDYSFVDNKPYAGLNFYQLKQVDFDGASELSPIRSVHFKERAVSFTAYPNPSTGLLRFQGLEKSDYEATVYSLDGKLLITTFTNNNQLDLSTLDSGVYFLKINNEYQRIIIQ